MKFLIFVTTLAFSLSVSANSVFDSDAQECVVKKVIDTLPPLAQQDPKFAGVWATDDKNWDMIFVTELGDGNTDRFFVSVKDGVYEKAHLYLVGLGPKEINISYCF